MDDVDGGDDDDDERGQLVKSMNKSQYCGRSLNTTSVVPDVTLDQPRQAS